MLRLHWRDIGVILESVLLSSDVIHMLLEYFPRIDLGTTVAFEETSSTRSLHINIVNQTRKPKTRMYTAAAEKHTAV